MVPDDYKGLDFPNVTLVGVLAADLSLNLPDYNSGERTFQLLTQVAGRAGRGEKEGQVIIQTYNLIIIQSLPVKIKTLSNFTAKKLKLEE